MLTIKTQGASGLPAPLPEAFLPRRDFFQRMGVAFAALSLGVQCRQQPAGLTHQQLDSLLPGMISKAHKLFVAVADCFPWPTQYREQTPQVDRLLGIIREHSSALVEANRRYTFQDRDRLYDTVRRDTYEKLFSTRLFPQASKDYSSDGYEDLLLKQLPILLSQYGYLARGRIEGITLPGIKGDPLVDGDYAIEYQRVASPEFETIQIDGRSWSRALIRFARSSDNFPPGIDQGQAPQSARGHIFYDIDWMKQAHEVVLNHLQYATDFIDENGEDFVNLSRVALEARNPKDRIQNILAMAANLAYYNSKLTLSSFDNFFRFIIQHHEDTHVKDHVSGRTLSLFRKEVNFSHSKDYLSFLLTQEAHCEASAILTEFCDDHPDSYGIADTLHKAHRYATALSSKDAPALSPHNTGANFVIDTIVEKILCTSSFYDLPIRDGTALSQKEQITLQLHFLQSNPSARQELHAWVSKKIWENYYQDKPL